MILNHGKLAIGLKNPDDPNIAERLLQALSKKNNKRLDRVLAWLWTVLGFLFIFGFVLQSLNIVLTVIAIALLVILTKKQHRN